jgi:hypothetical protein
MSYVIKVQGYTYPPLRGIKTMSIALGIECPDGAVLGTDRQITKEGGLKYQQRKISICNVTGNIPLQYAFAYCGDPDAAATIEREIGRELLAGICSSDVFNFDLVFADIRRAFGRKENKDLESLILMGSPSIKPFLLRTKGAKVVHGKIECIGVGDSSVIHYLSELLPKKLTLDKASQVVAYLVSLANRYIDGCGFGPDVVFMGKGRECIMEISEKEKTAWAQKFKDFESGMSERIGQWD